MTGVGLKVEKVNKNREKLFTLSKSVIYTPLRPNPNDFSYNPEYSHDRGQINPSPEQGD
jgi:hypothetical protein